MDPLYLQAVKELAEEKNVVFPKALINDLSKLGFDIEIITHGCEEHIYCATVRNFRWHYGSDDKSSLEVYKTMMLPTSNHDCPERGKWRWVFMSENQGCADWSVYYNDAEEVDPVVYCLMDGDPESTAWSCGTWSSFIEQRRMANI